MRKNASAVQDGARPSLVQIKTLLTSAPARSAPARHGLPRQTHRRV